MQPSAAPTVGGPPLSPRVQTLRTRFRESKLLGTVKTNPRLYMNIIMSSHVITNTYIPDSDAAKCRMAWVPLYKNKLETEFKESAVGSLAEVRDELEGLKNELKRI
jgi:hypothetical protein